MPSRPFPAAVRTLFALCMALSCAHANAQDAQRPAEPARASRPDDPVQSILLRAVTITYDLERSLTFYRDILGQQLMELNRLDTRRSQRYLEIGDRAEVWFASLRGSGEYAGGAVTGGRIAFLGIRDPDRPAARRETMRGRKGRDGDAVLPHRVSNLDEIMRRVERAGFEVLVPATVSSTGLSRSAMVFDPNGKIVELFELFTPPPTPAPARTTLPP